MPDPFSIAGTLFNIGKGLFDLRGKFHERNSKRRAAVATYFREIADCLDRTYAALQEGEYPHGECRELEVHADKLVATIGDYIGKTEAQKFADELHKAHEVELLHAMMDESKAKKRRELPKIDQAAGFFRGLSATVAAGPN